MRLAPAPDFPSQGVDHDHFVGLTGGEEQLELPRLLLVTRKRIRCRRGSYVEADRDWWTFHRLLPFGLGRPRPRPAGVGDEGGQDQGRKDGSIHSVL